MAAPTRQHTAVAGNEPLASNWNDVQDTFVELLNGTTAASCTINDSSNPTSHEIENSGGGKVVSFLVNGVEKAAVNAAGQWASLLSTGTAPFVVASTTEVANLRAASTTNATNLGGVAAASYVQASALAAATSVFLWHNFLQGNSVGAARENLFFVVPAGSTYVWKHLRARAFSGTQTLQNVDASADSTNGDSWTNQSGSTTGFYSSLAAGSGTSTYLRSALRKHGTSASECWVKLTTISDPGSDSQFKIKVKLAKEVSGSAKMDATVSLYQGLGTTLIGTLTVNGISTTPTDFELSLTEAQVANITDFSDLYLKFTADNSQGSFRTIWPSSDSSYDGVWDPGSAFWNDVDADDGNTQTNTSATLNDNFQVNMQNPGDLNGENTNITMEVKWRGVGAAVDMRFRLTEPGATRAFKDFANVGTSWDTDTHALTTGEADSVSNWNNVRLDVFVRENRQIEVNYLKLTMPYAADRVRFYEAYLEAPTGAITTTTVRARHYNSSGVLQNTETVDVSSTNTNFTTAVNSGSGFSLTGGDYIQLDTSVDGDGKQVLCQLTGTRTLS